MTTVASLHNAVTGALAGLGLHLADDAEARDGHALASDLISPDIASVECLWAVQQRTGLSVFAYREADKLTGIFAFLLLNPAGAAALSADALDAVRPDLALLSRRGEAPSAYYGWGFAGSTRPARSALVAGADLLRRQVLPHLPFYCHAATPAGRRAVTQKLGYVDIPGSRSGLLYSPPLFQDDRRAA